MDSPEQQFSLLEWLDVAETMTAPDPQILHISEGDLRKIVIEIKKITAGVVDRFNQVLSAQSFGVQFRSIYEGEQMKDEWKRGDGVKAGKKYLVDLGVSFEELSGNVVIVTDPQYEAAADFARFAAIMRFIQQCIRRRLDALRAQQLPGLEVMISEKFPVPKSNIEIPS
jgi:hypothetical protein